MRRRERHGQALPPAPPLRLVRRLAHRAGLESAGIVHTRLIPGRRPVAAP
ncbi:hypothetical protein RAA17_18725 [Komagataeibacter rhaeticus]|nr:hypothetical protein [Komagataeibacter rhaeticus]